MTKGLLIKSLFVSAALFAVSRQVFAQEPAAESPIPEPVKKVRKVSYVPLPAIFYTPETRLGLGALVMGVFRLDADTLTRSSNVQVLAAYTLNKQFINENTYNLFFPAERYIVNGEISFYDFPIYYYGVGNKTRGADTDVKEEKDQIDITYKLLYVQNRVLRKVSGPFFAGLQHRYTYLWDLEWKENSRIFDRPASELDDYTTSGLGSVLMYDSRNSVLNASRGFYAELSSMHHAKALGSEFGFHRYVVDLRKFVPLSSSTVVAGQVLGNFSSGAVPFREMGLLGGQNILRGYFRGRYRDKQYVATQAEVRQHVWGPVGVVAFAGAGEVGSELGDIELSNFKYAAGGGLRVMVDKANRINIRIDYGIGKNTSGFYFAIAEAF